MGTVPSWPRRTSLVPGPRLLSPCRELSVPLHPCPTFLSIHSIPVFHYTLSRGRAPLMAFLAPSRSFACGSHVGWIGIGGFWLRFSLCVIPYTCSHHHHTRASFPSSR